MFFNAEAYEKRLGRWSRSLAPDFIDFTGIKDGDRLLDVGSGTGSLTLALADRTRRSEIAGVDLSAPYIEYAHTRSSDPRIHFDVGDAENLPYLDACFNRSLALLLIHLLPSGPRVVKEMCRVTKLGGTVAACVWYSTGGMEVQRAFWQTAVALDPSAKRETHRPHSRPGELSALWAKCGLKHVEETALVIPLEFSSFDDLWGSYLEEGQGPVSSYLMSLSQKRQQAFREKLCRELVKGRPDEPFSLRARAWAVRGTVPG